MNSYEDLRSEYFSALTARSVNKSFIACHLGRLYRLPLARLLPEAEKSRSSSAAGSSSLVVVKISMGAAGNLLF